MWDIKSKDKNDIDPVGRPLKHKSADLQACGEATYIDDIPKRKDEVYLAFVLSSKAHAKILSVDTTEALKIEGVIDYIDHKDIGEKNNHFHTVVAHDEILFAKEEVFCVGQVIGVVVANDQVFKNLPYFRTCDSYMKK
jgi:xanthine dehydrogenase/oxidase